jgi:hypothetical protein
MCPPLSDAHEPDSVKIYTAAELLTGVMLLPDTTILYPAEVPPEIRGPQLCVFRRYDGVPQKERATADNPLCDSMWGEFQADSTLDFLVKRTVSLREGGM